jgi:small-conductance mechanosensitive channel
VPVGTSGRPRHVDVRWHNVVMRSSSFPGTATADPTSPADDALSLGDLLDSPYVSVPLTVLAIFVAALVTARVTHIVTRRIIRRIARRSVVLPLSQSGPWRTRERRGESVGSDAGEQRRRQRIDAAARMISHLVSVVIWIVATIVAFHLLDVEAAFFLSSAGFIGAGIAIGGQHKVNDYLTGLSVHFEDRYGVGDEIMVHVGWDQPVVGVVDHVGLFSTRLRDERSTLHFPNSALVNLRNLSQEAAVSTIRVQVPDDASAEDAKTLLRGLAGTDGLTDVIFVGDIATHEPSTGEVDIEVRTSRVLDDRSLSRLAKRTEELLDRP